MKKLLLTMLTILTLGFFAAPLSAQSTLTVHDGTATNGYVPVYGFYADAYLKAEFVYPASELTSITTNNDPILGLTFYATQSNVSWGNANFQVFLTEVTDATLSSFVGNSNATIVYEGSLSIVEGEMFIEFTTPYAYNGGNLLVGIYNTAIGSYVSSTWMGENVTGASVQGYSYQSLGDISASQHDFLPKTTFTYGAPALCAKPQNVTVPSVTTTDATISWVGSDDASSYTLQYMLASQTDWDEDAEEETSTDTAITLTNLTPGTTYQVRVRAICSDNNPTAWAPTVLFNTLNIPVVLPYFQDFETDPEQISDFTFFNDANGWYIGAATGTPSDDPDDTTAHSLYISNDGGATNSYSVTSSSYSYAVLDVVFNDDPVEWHLSFDWNAQGESGWDYFSVYLTDGATTIPASGDPTGTALLYHVAMTSDWQHEDVILENVSNSAKKIIFYWKNDGSGGTQPPVAVDNISIIGATCGTPYALTSDNISSDSYTFHFSPATELDDQWEVRIMSATDTVLETITDTTYTFLNLTPDTWYSISVRTVCGSEEYGDWSATVTVRTACAAVLAPYTENFAGFNTDPSACWERFSGLVSNVLAGGTLTPNSGGWYFSSENVFPLGHPKVNIYGTSCNYWLVSPAVDISELTTPVLKFEMALTDYGNEDPIEDPTAQADDKFMVLFSTDLGSTWDTTNLIIWDNAGSQNVYNQISNIPAEVIIPLSQYVDNPVIRVAFYGESTAGGGDNDLHIGNFGVIEMPTCIRPNGVTIASIGADEATITWNESDQTAWQVAFGPASNFDPEQVTPEDVTTNSITMQNLDANTTYSVSVRTVCGADEYSEWTAPISFVTLPGAPATIPYSYGFEDAEENAAWGLVNGSSTNAWYIAQPTEENDSVLFISSTGTSESYSNSSNADVWAYRDFQFGNGAEFTIDIKWKANGESCCDYLKVYIGAPNIITAGSSTQPSGSTPIGSNLNSQSSWQHLTYTLPASYANSTQRIYFLWHNDYSVGNDPAAVIDSIVITAGECGSPYAVHTTSVSTTTASFAFTPATETDDAWEYAICTGSEAPDNAQITDEIFDTEFTVDNLTAATHYTVYVRTLCGDGGHSGWSMAMSFVTSCDVITDLPWTEDFNIYTASNSTRPDCWSFPISYYDAPYITSSQYNSSPNSLYFQSLTSTPTTAVTPPFADELNTLRVKFMLKAESTTYSGTFEVGVVSNPNDMTTFESVAIIQPATTDWTQYIVDLDSVAMTGTGNYIAFRQNSNSGSWYYWLDDVTVLEIPACLEPTGLAVVDATTTSVDLTWNSSDNDFNLYYKSAADNEWSVEEHIDLTNGVYTLDNLTPSTTYFWKVSNNCSDGSESMSDQASFSTLMVAASIPYSTDFEDGSDVAWLFNNGTCANYWTIGSDNEESAMFITNDGTTAGYSVSSTSVVSSEKLFTIGDAPEFSISFDLKCGGESSYDYLKVFFAPATEEFPANATSVPTFATNSYSVNAVDFTEYLSSTGNTTYAYKINLTNDSVLHIETTMPNPNTTPDANSTAKLVFVWKNDSGLGEQPGAVIYNVALSELSCPKPTNLTVSNVTTTSADVAWTPGDEETSWNFEYKESTDATWTTVTTNTPSYQLTGLTNATMYDVRVQADCGNGDVSDYRETSFLTACDVVTNYPYVEGFENGLGCWQSVESTYTNYNWETATNDSYYTTMVEGSYFALARLSNYSAATVRLVSPIFDLTSVTNPYVKFAHAQLEWSGDQDEMSVYYKASVADEWTLLVNYTNSIASFTYDSIALPNPSATYQISFVASNSYGHGVALDDVQIYSDNGSGPVITNPTVATNAATGIGQTAATLNATITNPDNVTISAKGFEWKTTTGGTFTQIAGTGTGNTFTADLTTLTPGTSYTFKAFITYNGTTTYGQEMTFTTQQQGQPTEPSATTADATNVTYNSATLNGSVANPDNVTITAQGFQWKVSTASTYTTVNATGATMTYNLTGLDASTGYTFRAFVTTANGTSYGQEKTFTTGSAPVEPCDVPTGLTVTDVQSESISVTWDNAAVLRWNVQYGPVGGTLASATASTNSYTFTNLNPLTTYQIQVQAVCEEGNVSEWSPAVEATTTNLNSYLENNVTLYPNPAKEFVDVRIDGDLNVTGMEVYDVYGKLINTINVIDNTTHINVSGLANGMYFVRVTTEQGMVTKRFVKK